MTLLGPGVIDITKEYAANGRGSTMGVSIGLEPKMPRQVQAKQVRGPIARRVLYRRATGTQRAIIGPTRPQDPVGLATR